MVEPPKSVPKKQVWRVKPKHFKSLNNTWPPTCEHLDNLKPDFSGSTSKAKVVVAPTQNIYHCDFCDRDGHLAEFCFRRKRAERRDRYPAHGAYDCSDSRHAPIVRFSSFRSCNSAPASYRMTCHVFPLVGIVVLSRDLILLMLLLSKWPSTGFHCIILTPVLSH